MILSEVESLKETLQECDQQAGEQVFEHKNWLTGGFASKYKVDRQVYFERFGKIRSARKKQIKGVSRNLKNRMHRFLASLGITPPDRTGLL